MGQLILNSGTPGLFTHSQDSRGDSGIEMEASQREYLLDKSIS